MRESVTAALQGGGYWLAVVVGGSQVGKSRALLVAVRRCAPHDGLQLVALIDGESLRRSLTPGQNLRLPKTAAVL